MKKTHTPMAFLTRSSRCFIFVYAITSCWQIGHLDAYADGAGTLPTEATVSMTPYVDRYGQKIASSWAGKVLADTDLTAAVADESGRLQAWVSPKTNYDTYGGWLGAGWQSKASGYFRVEEHAGVWWLITPDGNPCFYKGLDTAPALQWETTPVTGREELFQELPATTGPFADAWGGDAWGTGRGVTSFAFCTANLIRKYGAGWKTTFKAVTAQRIHAWGFSGFGKWSDTVPGLPSFPVLSRTGVPIAPGARHPDPFDPAAIASLTSVLSAQMTPRLNDPVVVAWSVGNEYDETITPDEIVGLLGDGADVPAKRALVDYALNTIYYGSTDRMALAWNCVANGPVTVESLYQSPAVDVPSGDIELLRRFFADKYYSVISATVKSIDPNHLYAGSWIVPAWLVSPADWWLEGKYCDVIGMDNYGFDIANGALGSLIESAGKPVICGEFSFPQRNVDRGFAEFGTLAQPDESAAGRCYDHFVTGAAMNPYCVGTCWFQYRDQPITGRGPGEGPGLVYGENYPFGLVDITDNPRWTLLEYVRKANLAADTIRENLGK